MSKRDSIPLDDDTASYTISADGTRNYLPMKFSLDESSQARVKWFGKPMIVQKPVEYTPKDRIHSPIIVAKVQMHMVALGLMKSQHSVMVFRLPSNDKGIDAVGFDDRDVQSLWTPDPRAKPPSQLCGGCNQKFQVGDRMFVNSNGEMVVCEQCDVFMNPPIPRGPLNAQSINDLKLLLGT